MNFKRAIDVYQLAKQAISESGNLNAAIALIQLSHKLISRSGQNGHSIIALISKDSLSFVRKSCFSLFSHVSSRD